MVKFLAGSRDFSPVQGFQAKSVAHPASCSVGTQSIPKVKAGECEADSINSCSAKVPLGARQCG